MWLHPREDVMNKLVFAITFFLLAPVLRGQQAETKENSPQAQTQATPQAPTGTQNEESSLPAAIRPGHPLDPADVDILTGKRDREIEAARRAAVPISVGMYGDYGGFYLFDAGAIGQGL